MAEAVPGAIVDGRYRIVSRLGAGGMADVFLAEDEQLGRKVALKLLYRRFAEDPDFVERFRREAQAAAGLQHPNVVSVYDRGSFDDTYYIAMEYLPGRTLKQIIRQEAPLEPVRAIEIAIQILKAARFAHRRGVIHRDLKPHNVIVDETGHAKVTDFGIARAGASDMTETGSIMGTAQYLSPEQAQGHAVNEASDLYSIGVVLYEMLTGRVPFDAESAVTIALKHVSEAPVAPSVLNPAIPPELDQTVMWVLNKNSADRPADADQLIAVLEHCREAILAGTAGQHTASMAAVAAATAYMAPAAGGFTTATSGPATGSHWTDGSGQMPRVQPEEPEHRRRWLPWLLALLVLLLIAGAATAAYFISRPKQVTVPHVQGDTVVIATQTLEQAHFKVSTVGQTSRLPVGTVIASIPQAGTQADRGSTVTLTVSQGRGNVTVPFVQGRSVAEAERALIRAGLKVGAQVPRASATYKSGLVSGTNPGAGKPVPPNTTVTLFVSNGPPKVQVPSVKGDTQQAAATQLGQAGFNVNTVQKQSTSAAAGTVIAQSPAGGTQAPKHSTVTITVAIAPVTATVPNVKGDPVSGAISALTAAGFKVVQAVQNVSNPSQNDIVIHQSPHPNATAKKGSTVTIIIGHYVQTTTTTTSTTSSTTTTTSSST